MSLLTGYARGPWKACGYKNTVVNSREGNTLALAPANDRYQPPEEVAKTSAVMAHAPDAYEKVVALTVFKWTATPVRQAGGVQLWEWCTPDGRKISVLDRDGTPGWTDDCQAAYDGYFAAYQRNFIID